jgi:pyruvate dehydrogenase E1 component
MNTTPDGQFQTYSVSDGAFIRDDFFGRDPRLRRMVESLSDEQLTRLSRGGHDYRKVYAAFKAAREHVGQPTVILAQTIKGWTLGPDFEARNATHQMKKLTKAELKQFRDRLYLEISDKDLDADMPPYYHPGPDSDEVQYMLERRRALGGFLPCRVDRSKPLHLPGDKPYDALKKGSGKQEVATTMAFVRLLKDLMKDKNLGPRFVPIVPDEARTFGMDSLFPTAKIYSPHGQRYDPVDAEMLLSYKEDTRGQILHEGISEAGSMASVIAAGTSYATHGEPMIPVYVFYSMFGFQRTGDLMWAAGDQLTRGFLLGATAGRTTLNGEGLQHEDGHSLLLASTNPACISYDPAFAYEIAVIVKDALRRMYGDDARPDEDRDVFYYLTVYNEPKHQPAMPDDVPDIEQQILRGLYRCAPAPEVTGNGDAPRAQVLASGTAIHWALGAQRLLADDWGVAADVWSATSWTELRREALGCDEHNRVHAVAAESDEARVPFVTRQLDGTPGPVVAVSDWMRAVVDQIAPWVPNEWASLGTDGWGRSDTRPALRRRFQVDAESITLATLTALARRGEVKAEAPQQAIERYSLR